MDLLDELKADFEALKTKFEAFAASLVTTETPIVEGVVVNELEAVATGDSKDTGHILADGTKHAEGAAIGDAVSELQPAS